MASPSPEGLQESSIVYVPFSSAWPTSPRNTKLLQLHCDNEDAILFAAVGIVSISHRIRYCYLEHVLFSLIYAIYIMLSQCCCSLRCHRVI